MNNTIENSTGSFLTATQVAERLHISKGCLYELIARGEIGHTRVGRLVRIPEVDLQAFLEKNHKPATEYATTSYVRYPKV